MVKKLADIDKVIGEIGDRLDLIESMMAFAIRADCRFMVGDRVRLSAKARRQRICARSKNGLGRVTAVEPFTVYVKLDGYKGKPRGFNHMFWNHA